MLKNNIVCGVLYSPIGVKNMFYFLISLASSLHLLLCLVSERTKNKVQSKESAQKMQHMPLCTYFASSMHALCKASFLHLHCAIAKVHKRRSKELALRCCCASSLHLRCTQKKDAKEHNLCFYAPQIVHFITKRTKNKVQKKVFL